MVANAPKLFLGASGQLFDAERRLPCADRLETHPPGAIVSSIHHQVVRRPEAATVFSGEGKKQAMDVEQEPDAQLSGVILEQIVQGSAVAGELRLAAIPDACIVYGEGPRASAGRRDPDPERGPVSPICMKSFDPVSMYSRHEYN